MINSIILIIVCLINRNLLWPGVIFFILIDILLFLKSYHKESDPLVKCVTLLVRPIDSILWLLTVACIFEKHYILGIISLIFGFYIGHSGSHQIPNEEDELPPPFPARTQEDKDKYIIYLYNHFYHVGIWNFAISGSIYLYILNYYFNYSHLLSISASVAWIVFYVLLSRYILKINGSNHLGKEWL